MSANRNVTEIEAFSGKYVDFLEPRWADIELADIATGLANTCRFASQVSRFYSVAEHAVYVASLVPEPLALAALHHDSHEAYTGDITAPMKAVLEREAPGVLRGIAARLDEAIAIKLSIDPVLFKHPDVKMADDLAMFREAATLKYSHGRGQHWNNQTYYTPLAGIGWSPGKAERVFLETHARLCDQR